MSRSAGKRVFSDVEAQLNYTFKDSAILRQALVHRSYAHERGDELHNEPLEFLGDAVLGFVVAERIVRRRPDLDEGAMTRLRARLVNTRSLADEAKRLGLGEALLLGRGEERTGGRDKPSLLADALEAVIGAVFLDGGVRAARTFVMRLFARAIEETPGRGARSRDPKTALQEFLQARGLALPVYSLSGQEGPDHARAFVIEVIVDGRVLGLGRGTAKKRAEQEAAAIALDKLRKGDREAEL